MIVLEDTAEDEFKNIMNNGNVVRMNPQKMSALKMIFILIKKS